MIITRITPVMAALQPLWRAAVGCRAFSSGGTNAVDEINREMADVFGVPFAPEGTCLSPTSDTAAEAMLPTPPGWDSVPPAQVFSSAPAAAAAATAPAHQQPAPAAASAELLQELREYTQQLQAQVQQLQQVLAQYGTAAAAAASHTQGLQQQQQQQHPGSVWGAGAAGSSTAGTAWHQPADRAAAAAEDGTAPQHQQQQQSGLTHVDASGRASMVDVAGKASTGRTATASCRVLLGEAAYRQVAANSLAKGDVLSVAKIAGIQGAKATAQLIPLCHNIFISKVAVDLVLNEACHGVDIAAEARCTGQTGVEMEALTAAAVAALTVYDMTKAVSKGVRITDLQLESKEGGKSGVWQRV